MLVTRQPRRSRLLGLLQLRGEGALDRGQDDLRPGVELGVGVFHAGDLAPAIGWAGTNEPSWSRSDAPRRLDHVALVDPRP
jgi:hypothetical protein